MRIDYPALKAIKSSIVCAHLSAYGRNNSRQAWPGYDYLMQAEAGFMSLTGEPDAPPTRFGLSMVDFMTGTMWAMATVSAILKALRVHSRTEAIAVLARRGISVDTMPARPARGASPLR